MKRNILFTFILVAWLTTSVLGVQRLDPIQTVEINENRAIMVNQKPFFPIMIWLQDPDNFSLARSAGINTVAGYWSGSGNTNDVIEYIARVEKAGFYGVMPFDKRLKGNSALLAYIHGDEPDLPHLISDTDIVPSESLQINKKTPLWKIFDGVTHSWSVLDPLEGAEFTIELRKPVEVLKLNVWLTISKGLSVPKDVSFMVRGKEIGRATLKNQKGRQEILLKAPITLRELSFKVNSIYPGEQIWGSIGEIEGFDSKGNNVLLCPPRQVPRALPSEVLEHYHNIKAADASRPVFMTLTGHFLPFFKKWSNQQRTTLYPEYVKATDVIGYDIYPIYGWNKPEWLHLVHDGTDELRRLAGNRPVYAWTETSRGGQWTGALEKQKHVEPTHIRAEVWMALCRGATAIGYFTHIWKPEYKQFGVPPENVKAMKKINDQITRLSPVLLSKPARVKASIRLEGQLKSDLLARKYNGQVYIFAVNYDSQQKAGRAVITVNGLKAGTNIEVVDEARKLKGTNGAFADEFGPLGVHIYRFGL
jgi:hypothetical protein